MSRVCTVFFLVVDVVVTTLVLRSPEGGIAPVGQAAPISASTWQILLIVGVVLLLALLVGAGLALRRWRATRY